RMARASRGERKRRKRSRRSGSASRRGRLPHSRRCSQGSAKMITNGLQRLIAFVAAATLVLTACGSGSGNSVAGIDRTGAPVIASYGTVSAFGSVVVNGVHFDTSSSTFSIDGNPGGQADIAIGDVVLVKGSLDSGGTTGTATSVSFENNVVGPVTGIDATAETLVVLGQLVRVSADTSFDGDIQPTGLAGLAIGDIL